MSLEFTSSPPLVQVTIVQKLDDGWATGQRESRGIWTVVKMHVVLRESRIQIQDQSFFDLSVTDPDPDLDPVCLRRRRTFRLVGRVPGSAASTWIFPHGSGVTRPFAFFSLCASLVKNQSRPVKQRPSKLVSILNVTFTIHYVYIRICL